MSININLVNKNTSESAKDLKLRKVRTISFVILFVVAIFSVLLFLINLRFSVNYVKGQQNKIIESLAAYDETTSKVFILNQRTEDITSIISGRKRYHEKTELIFKNFPSSISINEYQMGSGGVVVNISSNSLLDLDTFLNYLLVLTKSKKLTSIKITEVSSIANGYSMKLLLN